MKTSLVDRRAVERLLLLVGALQSGLIDAPAEESPPAEIAMRAGTDPRASRVVLAALAAEGIVEECAEPGGEMLHRPTPVAKAHLLDEGPDLERFGLIHEVNKLCSTDDGGMWTEQQHREWLTGTGFTDVEVLDLEMSGGQLVLGRRTVGL